MVRPAALLHAQREPAPARAAATVLLVRDAEDGGAIEVLMSRRSLAASFAPGAWVFPGGVVDPADGAPLASRLADRRPDQAAAALADPIAAIREAWEELGVLLARRPGEEPTDADAQVAQATQVAQAPQVAQATRAAPDTRASRADAVLPRAILATVPRDADAATFFAAIEKAGLRLAVDRLGFYCHWITDRDLPRRFDTRFFVAAMPPGQTVSADNREQFEPVWITPAAALDRHRAGDFDLIYPTIRTLERLVGYRDTASLLAACAASGPHWVSSPRAGLVAGRVERFMENEGPFGELALTSPDGQIVHSLDWRRTEPVSLLRHVMRLTAPNPGVMTGPGTNTYLVGTPEHGYLVIDPGPALDDHVDRIHAIVGDRLTAILCTHSHADHSPGAARLQALTGAPIRGLASRPTANAQSWFRPDAEIADGERFRLEAPAGANDPIGPITLRAVVTPGHAANHVCFLVEEDGLLFSGDHILNGSTTIINPPDGNMVAYLDSLARLRDLDAAFILPAHGHVLGSPEAAIDQLVAHRLRREARVLAAIEARPGLALGPLVELAYADTPAAAHGIAQRSLLAHVEKLVAEGRVRVSGEGWTAG